MNQHEKLDLVLLEVQKANIEITYVKGILENNDKTGQKGVVFRMDDLEHRVIEIETKDSIRVGKATVIGGIFGGAVVPAVYWIGKLAIKFIF